MRPFYIGIDFDRPYLLPEKEVVDILFCGDTCEKTVDLAGYAGRVYSSKDTPFAKDGFINEVKCDDVCELFGGPVTRWEKIKFSLTIGFKVKLKYFYNNYLGGFKIYNRTPYRTLNRVWYLNFFKYRLVYDPSVWEHTPFTTKYKTLTCIKNNKVLWELKINLLQQN